MPTERYSATPILLNMPTNPSALVNAKSFLSDHPQLIDCPRCNVSDCKRTQTANANELQCHGETTLTYKIGLLSWITFFVLLVLGVLIIPLLFLWVPLVMDSFKDVIHRCPACNAAIGTYRRIGKSD